MECVTIATRFKNSQLCDSQKVDIPKFDIFKIWLKFLFYKQAAKNQSAMRAWFKDLAGNKPLSVLGRKVLFVHLQSV